MPVMIGAKPDAGFNDPIGMLKDCHRRIEHFLHILHQVCRRAQGRALSAEEHDAVQAAIRYFQQSGPRHNEDEEESVFPRMRARESNAPSEDMQRLEAEHQEAARYHLETDELYEQWMTQGILSGGDYERLLKLTERMQDLYAEHIRIEEEIVFPRAAKLFDKPVLDEIGAEFKARRAAEKA